MTYYTDDKMIVSFMRARVQPKNISVVSFQTTFQLQSKSNIRLILAHKFYERLL